MTAVQSIQNAAARTMMQTGRREHITLELVWMGMGIDP